MSRITLALGLAVGLGTAALAAPVTFTTEQDHQNMMDQLHIQKLRPGANGDEKAPGHANYDEALANPYPNWPALMTLKNGQSVTTEAQWRRRREELKADFDREVYGRTPTGIPKVQWQVLGVDHERLGGRAITATRLNGHVPGSANALDVNIRATLVTPDNMPGPVPVLIMFSYGGITYPAPSQPTLDELDRINNALKAAAISRDPSLKAVFDAHPGFVVKPAPPFFTLPERNADGDPDNQTQLIAAGWGFVTLDPTSAQPDNGAGLTRGIIGLVNQGQPRKPEDWGALKAWGWSASRVLDYLETRPEVDAKHVGIDGVSRYGKAALVTMAYDERFAMVLVGSSGEGGAKPHRRNWGEKVENLTGAGGYHWMAGNFLKYGGPLTPGEIPVDAHELIALCAPRLTFISYGVPEKGDARWLDHQGSFMATVAAQPAFRITGAKGLGGAGIHPSDDYHTEKMPGVNVGLLDGQLAWRQHDGGHTDAPNMKWFIQWVDNNIGYAAAK